MAWGDNTHGQVNFSASSIGAVAAGKGQRQAQRGRAAFIPASAFLHKDTGAAFSLSLNINLHLHSPYGG